MRSKAVSIRLSVSPSTSPNRHVCRQHLNRPPASLKKCAELLTTLAQNCTFAAILENIHEHLKNLVLWKTQTSSTLPSRAATFRTTGSTVSTPTANDARSVCAIVPPWLSASRAYGAMPSIHTLCARTGMRPVQAAAHRAYGMGFQPPVQGRELCDAPTLRSLMREYLGGCSTYYRYHHGEHKLLPEQQEWIKQLFHCMVMRT